MKHYISNVLNEDLLLKQNVHTCMKLIRYDSVWVRMKRSKQRYHDQAIEIMTGQAMSHLSPCCLRKDKMFDFLQKVMGTLPTARLSFGLGSGFISCKINPVLLLEFDEMQDHWGFFENTGGMQILIVTGATKDETALLFSGLLEESNKNPNLLCHQIE